MATEISNRNVRLRRNIVPIKEDQQLVNPQGEFIVSDDDEISQEETVVDTQDDNNDALYIETVKNDGFTVNPHTSRKIKIGGKLWKRLMKEGTIKGDCDLVEQKSISSGEVCELTTSSAINTVLDCIDDIGAYSAELAEIEDDAEYNKKIGEIEERLRLMIHARLLSRVDTKKSVEFYEANN